MEKQTPVSEKEIRIDKALDSAQKLGFRNTRIMLEGLRDQLKDFESRTVETAPLKADRIIRKVQLIEHALEKEWPSVDKEEVVVQAKGALYAKIVRSAFLNFAAGAFLFMLPDIAQTENLQLAVLLKVSAFSGFGLKLIGDIRKILLDAGEHTVESMKRDIHDLCRFSVDHAEKAIDEIRSVMNQVPPV